MRTCLPWLCLLALALGAATAAPPEAPPLPENVTLEIKGRWFTETPFAFAFTGVGPAFRADLRLSGKSVTGVTDAATMRCEVVLGMIGAGRYRATLHYAPELPAFMGTGEGARLLSLSTGVQANVELASGRPVTVYSGGGNYLTLTLTPGRRAGGAAQPAEPAKNYSLKVRAVFAGLPEPWEFTCSGAGPDFQVATLLAAPPDVPGDPACRLITLTARLAESAGNHQLNYQLSARTRRATSDAAGRTALGFVDLGGSGLIDLVPSVEKTIEVSGDCTLTLTLLRPTP